MKKTQALFSFVLTCFSFYNHCAYSYEWHGFHLGALVGVSYADYATYPFPPGETPLKIIDTGIAPMYAFGFNFNAYSALELGAIYLRKPVFKHLAQGDNNGRFKNNVVYFALKLSVLFKEKYRAFIKIGPGYVVRDYIIDQGFTIVKGEEIIRPVYGVGLSMRVGVHWELACGWSQAAGSDANLLPASNFVGVGVFYLFL